MKQFPRGSSLARLVVGVLFMLIAGLLLWQRVWVMDSVRLLSYTPSADITQIVARSNLSDLGERYFYASAPVLDGTSDFNTKCVDHQTSSAILGCYVGRKIYLYDITNEQLDGIEEVTAAHEMLHAAYDRLGSSDRDKVDKLINQEAQRLSSDSAFSERMKVYDDVSADVRLDELHSILATEVAEPGQELSDYYDQYFDDRSAVVKLYENYSDTFFKLEQQSEQLLASLKSIEASITANSAQYERDRASLESDISAFNARANSGNYTSQSSFNADRSSLLAGQARLESQRALINAEVERYNSQVNQLNSLGGKLSSLYDSLDSSLAPPPAVQ